MKLQLTRPLLFFDLETTGTDVNNDRIVEISVLKLYPDGSRKVYTTRVNPLIPIPAEASAVHHITNDMVASERTFAEIAPNLSRYFQGCDIAGFNSNRFDLPLLIQEFTRVKVDFDISDAKLIDVQTIYHKREPRNLTAAYRYYCGKELEGAHGAEADISATADVLLGQLDMYDDLPTDISGLARYTSSLPEGMERVDVAGKLYRDSNGDIRFNFGKFANVKVSDAFSREPNYFDFCTGSRSSLPADTKTILKKIK